MVGTLIHRPPAGALSSTLIWTSYTPTVTAGTGTFTTVSATGLYTKIDKLVFYQLQVIITTNGSAATSVRATLPSTTDANTYTAVGREPASTGSILQGTTSVSTNIVNMYDDDNVYPGGTGRTLVLSGWYREA